MKFTVNEDNQKFKIHKNDIIIKEIPQNQIEEAFGLCFCELVKYTIFSNFEPFSIEGQNIHITISKNYYNYHNTLVLGAYHNNDLVGVLEINDNYINQVAVIDEFKHQGIGYHLFLKAIENKTDKTEIYLTADKSAIETYKKWGFTSIEDEKKFFQNGLYRSKRKR